MTDDLAKLRGKKQNAKVRQALGCRVDEMTAEIEKSALQSKAPSAVNAPSTHVSDIHVRHPSTHSELIDHMTEHHMFDDESAESYSHPALLAMHNESHSNYLAEDSARAREFGDGWHFHARPMH